ncbi:hypothetical protein L21SP5_00613 [Salinivirga cyanobacteriivorans]|uniref:DUF2141 domain-containing protein n=1 Tax=Salinivirga cyanobacteriivorans TaxID=1307839 RepID=A0A0S2HW57_9BACT|nr:DUF2141 domain-containing protein [Salinivirga cyanobacteriivorans]ALO14285.1 hypothetical protein L21SP5_00613 [Salinivirga cyanobacteriivorans]
MSVLILRIALLIMFGFTSQNIMGQHVLTIKIMDLPENKGKIMLELMDSERNTLERVVGQIQNKRSTITIDSLATGQYAFRYFHDIDGDGELNTNWVGMPTEPYGFSNNVVGSFGPPAFERWLFDLRSNKEMICKPEI